MQKGIPHYGDILRKIEKTIESCQSNDQLNSTRRLVDLFYDHCERLKVNQETLNVITSSIANKLEDKWVELFNEKMEEPNELN